MTMFVGSFLCHVQMVSGKSGATLHCGLADGLGVPIPSVDNAFGDPQLSYLSSPDSRLMLHLK